MFETNSQHERVTSKGLIALNLLFVFLFFYFKDCYGNQWTHSFFWHGPELKSYQIASFTTKSVQKTQDGILFADLIPYLEIIGLFNWRGQTTSPAVYLLFFFFMVLLCERNIYIFLLLLVHWHHLASHLSSAERIVCRKRRSSKSMVISTHILFFFGVNVFCNKMTKKKLKKKI